MATWNLLTLLCRRGLNTSRTRVVCSCGKVLRSRQRMGWSRACSALSGHVVVLGLPVLTRCLRTVLSRYTEHNGYVQLSAWLDCLVMHASHARFSCAVRVYSWCCMNSSLRGFQCSSGVRAFVLGLPVLACRFAPIFAHLSREL